jgi:4-aminobutyrate aminotransferase-like enzyme
MGTTLQIEQAAHRLERHAQRVNPEWVRLLDLLQINVRYKRCTGVELYTDEGKCILDFLSGYCVHNVGHNHPEVVRALQNELERCGPAMIQTHLADLAGELAGGTNFMVLKLASPLVVTDEQLDGFVAAVRDVMESAHAPGAFCSEALGLARRAIRG